MKYRIGFVSNSSTASFIVTFAMKEFCFRDEIEQIIRLSDSWLDKIWDRTEKIEYDMIGVLTNSSATKTVPCEPESHILQQIDGMTYSLDLYTSMFNDWTSVPAWKFVRMLNDKKDPRFELVGIVKTEEEYASVEIPVSFDATCWELEHYTQGSVDHEDGLIRQLEIDREYKRYLKAVKRNRLA